MIRLKNEPYCERTLFRGTASMSLKMNHAFFHGNVAPPRVEKTYRFSYVYVMFYVFFFKIKYVCFNIKHNIYVNIYGVFMLTYMFFLC